MLVNKLILHRFEMLKATVKCSLQLQKVTTVLLPDTHIYYLILAY